MLCNWLLRFCQVCIIHRSNSHRGEQPLDIDCRSADVTLAVQMKGAPVLDTRYIPFECLPNMVSPDVCMRYGCVAIHLSLSLLPLLPAAVSPTSQSMAGSHLCRPSPTATLVASRLGHCVPTLLTNAVCSRCIRCSFALRTMYFNRLIANSSAARQHSRRQNGQLADT